MRIVGIDPGKSGAIALFYPLNDKISPGRIAVDPIPMLTSGKARPQYDLRELLRMLALYQMNARGIHAFVEKQQPLPAKMGGGNANYSRGYGLGILEMALVSLGVPYDLVAPRRWQALILADIPGDDTKQRALVAAQRLYGDFDLRRSSRARKPDPGFVDALLICEYGRRKLGGAG